MRRDSAVTRWGVRRLLRMSRPRTRPASKTIGAPRRGVRRASRPTRALERGARPAEDRSGTLGRGSRLGTAVRLPGRMRGVPRTVATSTGELGEVRRTVATLTVEVRTVRGYSRDLNGRPGHSTGYFSRSARQLAHSTGPGAPFSSRRGLPGRPFGPMERPIGVFGALENGFGASNRRPKSPCRPTSTSPRPTGPPNGRRGRAGPSFDPGG